MLQLFRNAISDEEMVRLFRKLFEKAEAGDASAAKLIMNYKIGKPLPAPHPDSIDRDEWDHYQQDAMDDKEMAVVMNALPTRVGNDIARVSLPIMTAARVNELAVQLCEGIPAQVKRDAGFEARDEGHEEKSSPIPNGEMSVHDQPSTLQPSPATTDAGPSTLHPSRAPTGKRSTLHDPRQNNHPPFTVSHQPRELTGKKGRAKTVRRRPRSFGCCLWPRN